MFRTVTRRRIAVLLASASLLAGGLSVSTVLPTTYKVNACCTS